MYLCCHSRMPLWSCQMVLDVAGPRWQPRCVCVRAEWQPCPPLLMWVSGTRSLLALGSGLLWAPSVPVTDRAWVHGRLLPTPSCSLMWGCPG